MRTNFLLTTLLLTFANLQMAQADTYNTYNVTLGFDEGSSFVGSFNFDTNNQTISGLTGSFNDAGMGDNVGNLNYQIPSTSGTGDGSGGILATVYLNETPAFTYTANDANYNTPLVQADINNALVTIDFNPSSPTAPSTNNINNIVFADCTSASGMYNCATDNGVGSGTMGSGGSGSETFAFVRSYTAPPTVAAVPLPSAVWSFLAGTLLLLRKKTRHF